MNLVERLRDVYTPDDGCGPVVDADTASEAADELERLTAEDDGHRKAQAAIFLALGTDDPNRETWPERIKELRERACIFGEIMAVLHRDGGHYLGEHGPQKAYDDAVQRWSDLMGENDAIAFQRDGANETAERWRQQFVALRADYERDHEDHRQTVEDVAEVVRENNRLTAKCDALRAKLQESALAYLTRDGEAMHWHDEAQRLAAERDALLAVIERAARVMRGEGVADQGEAWDQCMRILDAAIDAARKA